MRKKSRKKSGYKLKGEKKVETKVGEKLKGEKKVERGKIEHKICMALTQLRKNEYFLEQHTAQKKYQFTLNQINIKNIYLYLDEILVLSCKFSFSIEEVHGIRP